METDLAETFFVRRLQVAEVNFCNVDLSETKGLENVRHLGPSTIGIDTIAKSKGQIPEVFLQGCGLSDWEIEISKLYKPDLSNEQIQDIQYRMYDLRANRALQISPLFISYSHIDSEFVDKIGACFTEIGTRYWRDIHDMKAGSIEEQVGRAIRQNQIVILVLSEHSTRSKWVKHEVRTAWLVEKDTGSKVLCPIALDDSWRSSPWPKRIIERILKYNIIDFSVWKDDRKFDEMFHRLIDGLELFYKR
jgi:hypothetical protein